MKLRRLPLYVWALPTTSLGVIFLPLSLLGGGVQFIDGVVEIYGGSAEWFLRRCTLLKGGASAMTLGHIVLGRDRETLDLTREHERVHVRQCERWGPVFVPAYLAASAIAHLRGGNAYLDNCFEKEAFDATSSS